MSLKLRSIILAAASSLLLLGNVAFADVVKADNNATLALASQAATTKSAPANKININSADLSEIQKIKGMSKTKAKAIVDYRTKNGPYKSLEELLNVKCRGIHKNWLDKVSKFLTV